MLSKGFGSERGSALVEAAFALPLLALIVLGTVDFGRLFYRTMAVTHAARAGAQYGAQNSAVATNDSTMRDVAIDDATAHDILAGEISAQAEHTCYCFNGATETSISCTAGGCPGQLRVYATVTTRSSFSTVVNYPGIPRTVPIVRSARMRAQ